MGNEEGRNASNDYDRRQIRGEWRSKTKSSESGFEVTGWHRWVTEAGKFEILEKDGTVNMGIGELVRLKGDATISGQIVQIIERRGRRFAEVQFPDGVRNVPISQIEHVPQIREKPHELLERGQFVGPENLRQLLAHVRISGRLADMIYSMEASDTDFYAHQFKPVLKLLSSPTNNLLVADEVGLGKTIEAGLIWTELAARFQHRRLLVVCPKVLCEKWKLELEQKFDLDPVIMDAEELRSTLASETAKRRGFVAICGMQGLRPPKADGSRTDTKASRLAALLEASSGGPALVDLLVVDEAHHMRNPDTATSALGRLLAAISEHIVLLSATPIHLRNRDLHSLLRLVDDITFRDPNALEEIIYANGPVIAARDAVLKGGDRAEVLEHVRAARATRLLGETRQLKRIEAELENRDDTLSPDFRAVLANRLDRVNLLANVVNRTRRRDVEDFRVVRQVSAHAARMHKVERDIYDGLTMAIHGYAFETDLPPGFLVVTPQRMLASCLPAAIRHWKGTEMNSGSEDVDVELDDDAKIGPLRQRLKETIPNDLDIAEIERLDSKYELLSGVLREHFEKKPREKVILFSSFIPTLHYLERRLKDIGLNVRILTSASKSRTQLISEFRDDPDAQVLLSSEVGSEGIDLQFARVVINYDLPWNPMRVEQRIGRVDRLGQEAKSVSVINLYHHETIDQEIYDRLYRRLRLCENALGGFEDILGERIPTLTAALMSGKLSKQQQDEMIEQTCRALAQRQQIEDELEREAASLIAHGDYVLKSIREAHDEHRWVTDDDLVEYLRRGFGAIFPGSEIREHATDGLYEIRLSPEARHEFERWCRKTALPVGRFGSGQGWTECRIGKGGPKKSRSPRITHAHSLVRFLSEQLVNSGELSARPAVALEVPASKVPWIGPGIYTAAIQLWKLGSGAGQEKLAYTGAYWPSKEILPSDNAERLINHTIGTAKLWHEAQRKVDLSEVSRFVEEVLFEDLGERFDEECEIQTSEIEDRISIQLATLEQRVSEQRGRLLDRIDEQRRQGRSQQVIQLAEGQLRSLEERAEQRRLEILNQRKGSQTYEDIATIVISVTA